MSESKALGRHVPYLHCTASIDNVGRIVLLTADVFDGVSDFSSRFKASTFNALCGKKLDLFQAPWNSR
jgi:hypothetical protein